MKHAAVATNLALYLPALYAFICGRGAGVGGRRVLRLSHNPAVETLLADWD